MAVRPVWLDRLAGLGLAVLSLQGCAGQGVTVLHASDVCMGGREREVRWLAGPDELARLWRLNSRELPAPSAPAVDFTRMTVLYLADRERSTGGYGLGLADDRVSVSGRVARLVVRTAAPAGMAPQVVTRPCLWLALPVGDYDRVEIVDRQGVAWGGAARPALPAAH